MSAPRCRRSPRSENAPIWVFIKPRFDVYKAILLQIRSIFAEYTPIIEPLSLDEAYLDVTENLPAGAQGPVPLTGAKGSLQSSMN